LSIPLSPFDIAHIPVGRSGRASRAGRGEAFGKALCTGQCDPHPATENNSSTVGGGFQFAPPSWRDRGYAIMGLAPATGAPLCDEEAPRRAPMGKALARIRPAGRKKGEPSLRPT